jgi:Ca2+-binding EF-hand superfamily protein
MLTTQELSAVESKFKEVDLDGNGLLSIDEVCKLFEDMTGVESSIEEVTQAFEEFDDNSDGTISFTVCVILLY